MKKLIAIALSLAPLSALAQAGSATGQITNVTGVFDKFTYLGNAFITVIISLAVLYIIFNVFRYLVAGGEEDRKKGGMAILYGVLALVIILSIWGLVGIIRSTFNTGNQVAPTGDFPTIVNPGTNR